MLVFFLCVILFVLFQFFFFSSRRRHTRWTGDWSSDVCSSDLLRERVEEERRIRGRLERYHSPQVIEEIIAHAEATGAREVALTKSVTVLFADLVGFTSWSEKMAASELASLLTRFFTLASEAIFSQDGTIDKFIGDAVMAFFGAPFDQRDHAVRAVSAALKVQE